MCYSENSNRGVAQWLEQGTHNPLVVGSSPTTPTIIMKTNMKTKKTQGYTLLHTSIATLIIGCMWVGNLVRFIKCDFEKSYRGEVLHGVGLMSPTCIVTCWKNWDKPSSNEVE